MVFIDTPLDIAMARRLLRDTPTHTGQVVGDSIKSLKADLSSYLNGGQSLYLELEKQIKRDCDMVLDGRLGVDERAARICKRLGQQQPH